MKDDRFDKMMEGVKQGAAYLKGSGRPSRVFEVKVKVPDAKGIRGKLKISQPEFARMLGISVRTLQNWEQKRRVPDGPARVLLALAAAYPEQVREVSRKIVARKGEEKDAASPKGA
ncbi:MAG: helix-turn-helix domain-containing protein [Thermodesulfobacteriota bacterium]